MSAGDLARGRLWHGCRRAGRPIFRAVLRSSATVQVFMTPVITKRRRRAAAAARSLRKRSARCRNGIWPISIPRSTRRRSSATSNAARPSASRSRRPTRASSRTSRPAPTPAARSARRCGATRRSRTCSGGSISYAGLLYAGNTTDPVHRQVLRRHAGAHHRGLAASAVLHARAQPHRRRGAGKGDGRSGARPLPAVARGHPQGQALPARGSRRAAVPRKVGDRLFRLQPAVRRDHGRRCASRSAARRCRSSRRST